MTTLYVSDECGGPSAGNKAKRCGESPPREHRGLYTIAASESDLSGAIRLATRKFKRTHKYLLHLDLYLDISPK